MSYSGVGGTSLDGGYRKLTASWSSCCEGFSCCPLSTVQKVHWWIESALPTEWIWCKPVEKQLCCWFLGLRLCSLQLNVYKCKTVEQQGHITRTTRIVRRETNQDEAHNQTQSLGCRQFNSVKVLMDVSGLFLGATKLQGAGCLRSCSTSSVLGKRTDKNIFGECGALENPQDTNTHHTHMNTQTHTYLQTHTNVPPTWPTQRQCSYHYLPHRNRHTLQLLLVIMFFSSPTSTHLQSPS